MKSPLASLGRTGMKAKKVPVEVERDETIITKDEQGNYVMAGRTPSDAPKHEDGGVKLELNEGDLVFPKKYDKELSSLIAGDGTIVDQEAFGKLKDKMLFNANKAAESGKPYSSGGFNDNHKKSPLGKYRSGGGPGDPPKKLKPIYVDDENDPRYKSYQDSLNLYNNARNEFYGFEQQKEEGANKIWGLDYGVTDYEDNAIPLDKMGPNIDVHPYYKEKIDKSKIKPTGFHFSDMYYTDPVYKEPVQPIKIKAKKYAGPDLEGRMLNENKEEGFMKYKQQKNGGKAYGKGGKVCGCGSKMRSGGSCMKCGGKVRHMRNGGILKFRDGGDLTDIKQYAGDLSQLKGTAASGDLSTIGAGNPVRKDLIRIKELVNQDVDQSVLNGVLNEFDKKYSPNSNIYALASSVVAKKMENTSNPRTHEVLTPLLAGRFGKAGDFILGKTEDISDDDLSILTQSPSAGTKSTKTLGGSTAPTSMRIGKDKNPGNRGVVSGQQEILNEIILEAKAKGISTPEMLRTDDVLGPMTRKAMEWAESTGQYKTPDLLSKANVDVYKKTWAGYSPEQKAKALADGLKAIGKTAPKTEEAAEVKPNEAPAIPGAANPKTLVEKVAEEEKLMNEQNPMNADGTMSVKPKSRGMLEDYRLKMQAEKILKNAAKATGAKDKTPLASKPGGMDIFGAMYKGIVEPVGGAILHGIDRDLKYNTEDQLYEEMVENNKEQDKRKEIERKIYEKLGYDIGRGDWVENRPEGLVYLVDYDWDTGKHNTVVPENKIKEAVSEDDFKHLKHYADQKEKFWETPNPWEQTKKNIASGLSSLKKGAMNVMGLSGNKPKANQTPVANYMQDVEQAPGDRYLGTRPSEGLQKIVMPKTNAKIKQTMEEMLEELASYYEKGYENLTDKEKERAAQLGQLVRTGQTTLRHGGRIPKLPKIK